MEETLISFETAKLAKEKGFDWKVTNYFTFNGVSGTCGLNSGFFETESRQSTQSLLQKWLREKHKITILITQYDEFREDYFYPYIVRRINTQHIKYPFPTYEEALETGLFEALKLIK